jgi:hypothetical protein
MPRSIHCHHSESVTASAHRRDDWNYAYHVRPVVINLGDRRQTISPLEAQLLLGELGHLPRARHRAAEKTATDVVHGLAAGCAIPLDEDGRRTVLRAIEGVRARRGLSGGLGRLRELLVRSPEPVV